MPKITIWEKKQNPNQSPSPCSGNLFYTRMHSSTMRTIRSVSRLPRGGVLPGGVLPRECASGGVCFLGGASQGGVWSGGVPAWSGG